MNRQFVKENKTVLREFIGKVISAILSGQVDSLIKRIETDPKTKDDVIKLRKLTKDMDKKLKKMQKDNPELVNQFRKKYGY